MKIFPLNNRVFVEPIYEDDISKGGIIIPEQAKEKPIRGIIISVGEGKIFENGAIRIPRVKPGDIVMFGRYAGSEIKIDRKDLRILLEDDIFCVIKEEDNTETIPVEHDIIPVEQPEQGEPQNA